MGGFPKRVQYVIEGLVLLLAVLIVWEWSVRSQAISVLALPLPSKVLVRCLVMLGRTDFLSNWYRTLIIWLSSLTIGLLIGLILGFVSGASRRMAYTLLPLLGYFRSIPPIALFPVALIAIGPGGLPIAFVAALGAALYVYPGTAEAARNTADKFYHLGKILGSNKFQFLAIFVAPGAAVHAITSSRVAATYSFAVCVAGEMIIGGRFGVGAAILDFSDRYQLESAYAYILYTGIIGLLIDLIFGRLTRLRVLGTKQER